MTSCIVCCSDEISPMSIKYCHENHLMCDICLKDSIRICTCTKKLLEKPEKLVIYCPCTIERTEDPNYKPHLTKVYFDIPSETSELKELLTDWYDKYKIMSCCRGCSYTTSQIQTNLEVAGFSCMETCVFDLEGNYLSDEVDQNFIDRLKKLNPELIEILGFNNITEI